MEISKRKLKELYIVMKKCRMHEERAVIEYRKGNICGNVHSAIGQEAIATAVCSFLNEDDYVFPSHRGYCGFIARGARLDKLWAEMCGRETGYAGGRGGSLHPVALDRNIPFVPGTVGSQVVLASGVGLGFKMRNLKRVAVAFFGDGATTTGAFHEGVSFAAAFDLPVVFVCENNQYEESTHWKYWCKLDKLAERASGYGIPGVSVDGNDVEAVAEVAEEAIKRAREGKGPTLIEGLTYRILGHHMGDTGYSYRSKEEIEEWKKKDPINNLYHRLLQAKAISEKENQEIEAKISEELDEAVRFALESPVMNPERCFRNTVYFGWEISLNKV